MINRLIGGIAVVALVVGGYFAWRQWVAGNRIALPSVAENDSSLVRNVLRPAWMDREQPSVYEAVIEQFFIATGLTAPIVISGRTLSPPLNGSQTRFSDATDAMPKLSHQTWASYVDTNRRDEPFSTRLTLSLSSMIETDVTSWDEFYAKHPTARGRLTLSRVGFNDSGSQALVYVWHGYGNLGAVRRAFLLEKRDGKWIVVQDVSNGWA